MSESSAIPATNGTVASSIQETYFEALIAPNLSKILANRLVRRISNGNLNSTRFSGWGVSFSVWVVGWFSGAANIESLNQKRRYSNIKLVKLKKRWKKS